MLSKPSDERSNLDKSGTDSSAGAPFYIGRQNLWLPEQTGFCSPASDSGGWKLFRGIEVEVGAERGQFCAAVDSAGGAQSWARAPELQKLMTSAVKNARVPIFFFQAENDYSLSPSRTLAAAMKEANKPYELTSRRLSTALRHRLAPHGAMHRHDCRAGGDDFPRDFGFPAAFYRVAKIKSRARAVAGRRRLLNLSGSPHGRGTQSNTPRGL